MKNIHILATDKPSRLSINCQTNLLQLGLENRMFHDNLNIYITNDEEIKEGDYCIDIEDNIIFKVKEQGHSGLLRSETDSFVEDFCKKIILTTDQDLINDKIQDIDDEFLEWLVKNPGCEEVEVKLVALNEFGSEITVNSYGFEKFGYKIITPKEESKQETSVVEDLQDIANHLKKMNARHKNQELEEAAKNYAEEYKGEDQDPWFDFMEGAKWQQERSYSEDDLREAFKGGGKMSWTDIRQERQEAYYYDFQEWLKQFKKK